MTKRKIGALIYPGFEMLDYYGPLEMYSMFRDDFEIIPVAQSLYDVPASGGPKTTPTATFDRTDFQVLLIPGGDGVRKEYKNAAAVNWVAECAKTAELVCTVCTGAALLAATGLLDNRPATTNKLEFDWVVSTRKDVKWQRHARWVEDENFFTSSGVSAGIDMTLAAIGRMLGPEAAENAALWAEYVANTDPNDDPFS